MAKSHPTRASEALPDFKGASISIGGFMAGLEHEILHKRPPAAIVVDEEVRSEPRRINGLQLEGPDEPIERREPPDTSGARLPPSRLTPPRATRSSRWSTASTSSSGGVHEALPRRLHAG